MSETTANQTAGDPERTTEKLLHDLRTVVEDGEALLRAGAHDLSERGRAARERLAAAIQAAKETGKKLETKAVEGARATDRIIHEHPYQSMGVAFGVGVLLGVLLSRK